MLVFFNRIDVFERLSVIFPTLAEVNAAASEANVIPICKSILADTETPVSVWMKLFRGEKYSFLLESVTGDDAVARYSFIGGNPYMTFVSQSGGSWQLNGTLTQKGTADPIAALRNLFKVYKEAKIEGIPRFAGGAVGYFSYDSIRLWEDIPDSNPKDDPLDELFFGFYRDLLVFDNKEHRLLLISNIFVEPETVLGDAYAEAVARIHAVEERLKVPLVSPPITITAKGEPVSNVKRADWEKAVDACKEYIKAGDIFQVVLSQRFSVAVDADPFDLYRILRVVNPSPYMFYLSVGDTAVVGASPEILVRVEEGTVEVRPIAGTCRRGKNDAEDKVLIDELLADPKERAEHIMLVDLGRNDVGRVCTFGSVHVEEMMHVEKYSHVIHLVSNVSGKLNDSSDVFDALFSGFPAGTLSGAPKIRAMEIIDEFEVVKRGLYGGALGHIDFGGRMDTCIVIRTIVYHDGIAAIQVGAGIVADSVPAREYQETVEKASALFTVIAQAARITGES